MKIGIIGLGVVGSAVFKSFEKKNLDPIGYDKYKHIGTLYDTLLCELLFLCLPTPYDPDIKSYNKDSLDDVCQQLKENNFMGLVVIKSTVEPETSVIYADKYNLKIAHNPEFLTARMAFEDFENQEHIVIGYNKSCPKSEVRKLAFFYQRYYPTADVSLCHSNESELMKLGVNNFYSVKIQFFNELYCLSQKMKNTSYNKVKNLMIKNNWINPMHTEVPGTDGQLSYGGMCFPKDTNALLQFMIHKGSQSQVLDATVNERNIMREMVNLQSSE